MKQEKLIITENELTDMFGEGGKEEVLEYYEELNKVEYIFNEIKNYAK